MSDKISESSSYEKEPFSDKGNATQWSQKLDGEATLTKLVRTDKNIRIVAAEHFSKKAADFFQQDIAKEITDPSTWIFFIEGKDSGIYECEVAKKLAQERKIPIVNPIAHPYQKEIIGLYLTSVTDKSMKNESVMGQLAAQIFNARGTNNFEEVASFLEINPLELHASVLLAVGEKDKDPVSYTAKSKEMNDSLTRISNLVSAQVLDYYLRQYPERSNVAVYLGKLHEEIVNLDLSSIPERLRFSDEKIKEMIQAKEEKRVEQLLKSVGINLPKKEKPIESSSTQSHREPNSKLQEEDKKDKVSKILDEMSDVPNLLKTLIIKWSKNLFGLNYVRKRGYQRYLNSDSSLDQIWGAGALLADRVDNAKAENRSLTSEEILEIKSALMKAALSRKQDEMYRKEGDELFEIANGVQILEQVIRKL